jgi:hypothetical protein
MRSIHSIAAMADKSCANHPLTAALRGRSRPRKIPGFRQKDLRVQPLLAASSRSSPSSTRPAVGRAMCPAARSRRGRTLQLPIIEPLAGGAVGPGQPGPEPFVDRRVDLWDIRHIRGRRNRGDADDLDVRRTARADDAGPQRRVSALRAAPNHGALVELELGHFPRGAGSRARRGSPSPIRGQREPPKNGPLAFAVSPLMMCAKAARSSLINLSNPVAPSAKTAQC